MRKVNDLSSFSCYFIQSFIFASNLDDNDLKYRPVLVTIVCLLRYLKTTFLGSLNYAPSD